MGTSDPTYPPLDVPKAVARDVWIVDSGPLRVMGLIGIPVRMTVLRLNDGNLALHSPTRFEPELLRKLAAIGPVRHLIAPNSVHWSFLAQWQARIPEAITWAAPGLRRRSQVRHAGLRLDHDLDAPPGEGWPPECERILIRGAGGFREVAIFHAPSRTLVLTDLIANMEPAMLPLLLRPFARLAGVMVPHGQAPIYLRAAVRAEGHSARAAAERLVALAPERVIFSHGRWFETDGTARLRHAFGWLLLGA